MRKLSVLFLCGVSVLLACMLTGCQADPPDENSIMQDVEATKTIYVRGVSHTMAPTSISIVSRTTEKESDTVTFICEMTDGLYSVKEERCYTYGYYDGKWTMEYSEPICNYSISYIGDEAPEELLSCIAEWEDSWGTENVKRVSCEKNSETQFDLNYTVSKEEEYLIKAGTADFSCYLCASEDNPYGGGLGAKEQETSPECYYSWYYEGTEDINESWNLVGEYQYLNRVTIIVDSFNPETNELHIAYAKERKDSLLGISDEWKEISDITVQLERIDEKRYDRPTLAGEMKIWYTGPIEFQATIAEWNHDMLTRVS